MLYESRSCMLLGDNKQRTPAASAVLILRYRDKALKNECSVWAQQ